MTNRAYSREAILIASLASFAVYVLALLSPAIFNDADTFWHIRAGQWMLAHRTVLTFDPFSLPFAGKPWETQEWLAEIAFAAAFQWLGWSGVAILTGLAMAAATLVLASYLARRLDPISLLVVLVLALGCVMPDYLARPHILALPCLVAWIAGLADAAAARRRPSWLLIPVMIVWANLHGSFVFGLAFIAPMALEAVLANPDNRKRISVRWALFAAAAIGTTLLNPRGFDGLAYPFELMRLHSLSAIGEWQSSNFHALNPMELAVLAAIFFFVWKGAKVPVIRLLVLLALFHMALAHARYSMMLGIVGAILLADPLRIALSERTPLESPARPAILAMAGLASAMLASAALRAAYPIQRFDEPGAAALAAIPASLADKPVFNTYSFGGILIFNGIRPLVDSRADFYGDAYLDQYARTIDGDPATVDSLFAKYRVAWTMLDPGDPLVASMDRRKGWHRIYADRYAVIHVGPNAAARLAQSVAAADP
jgi:hypothetical protein